MAVRTSDFDYELTAELIAQEPHPRRDQSRLMVLHRSDRKIEHHRFDELPDLLRKGDLLVLNDTKVIPGKFQSQRRTGAKIDGLFLREMEIGKWEVLLRNASRSRPGETLELLSSADMHLELVKNMGAGRWEVKAFPPVPALEILERVGLTPLPPYIRRDTREVDLADRTSYQTVYAAKPGAVAAPTAGLHFTHPLLDRLHQCGIETTSLTLHVGLGTFAPVKQEDLTRHKMHSEWYELSQNTANLLNSARRENRRIIAVGTTSVRVLETIVKDHNRFAPTSGQTDLFIYPPARFHTIDALITNFHLPRSTLLMLVAAFCSPGTTDGIQTILEAYREAVHQRYRFYSYGDAMLIQ